MPLRRHRSIPLAGIAVLALLAAGTRHAHAQQVSLNPIRGLDFGRFVAGSGGAVVVTPAGLRSRTGAVVLLNSPGAGQAAINVSRGSGKKTVVDITLPANGSISLSSGANSMAVGSFVSAPAFTMTVATPATLSIGATMSVAPNQPPGTYSGTFPVTVNFQ